MLLVAVGSLRRLALDGFQVLYVRMPRCVPPLVLYVENDTGDFFNERV